MNSSFKGVISAGRPTDHECFNTMKIDILNPAVGLHWAPMRHAAPPGICGRCKQNNAGGAA